MIRNVLNNKITQLRRDCEYLLRTEKKFKKLTPSIFSIEITLGCNLKCPECKTGSSAIKRKKGNMTFDQLTVIADKIRPYADYVYLHIWGEPLLNQDVFRMVKYISKFSRLNISTNGQLVDDEIAEKLILSGVTDIIVSIDGVTQDIYEKYRVGGDVRKAFKALDLLCRYKEKNNANVNIIPQFVVFKHNEHQTKQFKDICESYGLTPNFKSPYINKNSYFERPTDHRFWRSQKTNYEQYCIDLAKECQDVRSVMTILLDGSVVPCCYDSQGELVFGNLFKQDVLEIWNSQKYYKFRYNIYCDRIPKFCIDNCLMFYYDK
jgi:MoaA/NifB/PqqE/SkfB family radical SAM enzyme